MDNIKDFLSTLDQYRNECSDVIRGELPNVEGAEIEIFKIIKVIFASLFLIPICFLYVAFSLLCGKNPAKMFETEDNLESEPEKQIEQYDYEKCYENYYEEQEHKENDDSDINIKPHEPTFKLWVGKSTGGLIKLWHRAGMAADQHVSFNLEDACQNILALGAIGSGKTTCVMQPLLLQCITQDCGGLIFDIKGDVKHAVCKFSELNQKNLVILGPTHKKINLLAGLTPEIAASFLKSAFLLGNRRDLDSFWIDTAAELCRNTLGKLYFLPKHYSLLGLYQYLFSDENRKIIDEEICRLIPNLDEHGKRLLKVYTSYHDTIFSTFDDKIKSGVKATVSQVLAPFSHPALFDAFCSTESGDISIENILTGTLYLVDMPLSTWGLGGKVAYTFVKLRFFNLMQNRRNISTKSTENVKNTSDSKKPVFFMCDEFQEIVSANKDGLSDLNFWDKSRSSRTIGIISSQSISSFYAAIGNRDLAHALLQNFRQKICLRTEDPLTVEFIGKVVGNARVKKVTVRHYNQDINSYGDNASHCNSLERTVTDARESVIDAQLFREMSPLHAVAVLSLNGSSMDDVISLLPIYTDCW